MPSIAVLNESTRVSDVDAVAMTYACALQLARHVAPAWAMVPVKVTFVHPTERAPAGARCITIRDAPDVPGLLGYHEADVASIRGHVYANPILDGMAGSVLGGEHANQRAVSAVLSHEIIEMFLDPYVNMWADGPLIDEGSSYAFEACDPVEDSTYAIEYLGRRCSVSNFVYPHWFDPHATIEHYAFDHLHQLRRPFSVASGGYMVVRNRAPEHLVAPQRVAALDYPQTRVAFHEQFGEFTRSGVRLATTQPRSRVAENLVAKSELPG